MNAKFLLRKYLNTGVPIPEYQFNKLNPNLRTTYIRKRSIAIESGRDVQTFEIPYISQDTWIKSVEKTPEYIRHIKNPTPQVQMVAIKDEPYNIRYVKNPTPQVQMVAVENSPYVIQYIIKPTDEVQDYIFDNDSEFIRFIKNPNEKIKQYKLDNNINESRIKIIINESQLKTIIKDIL
jgi:hypothetical protein